MKTEEIRKLLEEDKLIIGQQETRKALKAGELSTVLIAANAPEMESEAMQDYAEMAGAEAVVLEARNDQLGTICRKPFQIAFCGVKK